MPPQEPPQANGDSCAGLLGWVENCSAAPTLVACLYSGLLRIQSAVPGLPPWGNTSSCCADSLVHMHRLGPVQPGPDDEGGAIRVVKAEGLSVLLQLLPSFAWGFWSPYSGGTVVLPGTVNAC